MVVTICRWDGNHGLGMAGVKDSLNFKGSRLKHDMASKFQNDKTVKFKSTYQKTYYVCRIIYTWSRPIYCTVNVPIDIQIF